MRPAVWLAAASCGLLLLVAGTAADDPAPAGLAERQLRRAYDGAPPVIPHESFNIDCDNCHTVQPVELPGGGWSPASPHRDTAGIGSTARCRQCHVFKASDTEWRASRFEPFRRASPHGPRAHPLAPPRMPHGVFMHENCAACHTGPGARPEIVTSHPERTRCRQCHIPAAPGGPGLGAAGRGAAGG